MPLEAWEPTIDKNTVLCIVSEDELADCEEKPYESPPDPKSVVTPVPVFTVADKPPRRRRRAEDKPRIADVEVNLGTDYERECPLYSGLLMLDAVACP